MDKEPAVGRFFGLRAQMSLSFGLLFAVTLAISLAVDLYGIPFTGVLGEYRQRQRDVIESLNVTADARKELFVLWVEERKNDLKVLSESVAVGDMALEYKARAAAGRTRGFEKSIVYRQAFKRLKDVKNAYKVYDSIAVADPLRGVIIASTQDDDRDIDDRDINFSRDVSRRECFKGALKVGGETAFNLERSDTTGGRGDSGIMMEMSRAVKGRGETGRDSSPLFVIIMHVNTDNIIRPLLQAGKGLGATGEVLLVDDHARTLTTPAYPLENGTWAQPLVYRMEFAPALLAVQGREGIAPATDYRGRQVLAAYRHINLAPGADWGMVLKRDSDEIFQNLHYRVYYLLMIAITGLALVFAAVYVISDGLSYPVTLLSRAAAQIGAGELGTRAPEVFSGEVGALARSFNLMAAHVQERTGLLTGANERLTEEMTIRRRMEEAIIESERRLREITSTMGEGLYVLDAGGAVTLMNPEAERLLGWSEKELLGRRLHPLIYAHARRDGSQGLADSPGRVVSSDLPGLIDSAGQDISPASPASTGSPASIKPLRSVEDVFSRRDGSTFSAAFVSRPIIRDGEAVASVTVFHDITDRKKMVEQIRGSLREKEALLREVHHRVKNNLQVITSLLKLQSGFIEDPVSRCIFKESEDRVKSMALVHERLHQGGDLSNISFGGYIDDIVNVIFRSYPEAATRVVRKIEAEDIALPLDIAVPFGLVMTEIVSNSLKYAFNNGRRGTFFVVLQKTAPAAPGATGSGGRDNRAGVELVIGDDGAGPPEVFDLKKPETLGIQLIVSLVEGQLHGTIDIDTTGGLKYTIRFAPEIFNTVRI
jgi:two-component sensor histidine kinase/HAMP domain-containing protein